MPISINLLAEAQALEDMRRRDPVKRAIWVGAGLLIVGLAWSGSLQLKAMMAKSELSRIEAQLGSRKTEYDAVVANQQKLDDCTHRLDALQRLATNRLLQGTLLNALQQTTLDDVQLTRFRVSQSYVLTDEVKPKTSNGHTTPGRPASVTEQVQLNLEARDSSIAPGDQVTPFKHAFAKSTYFQSVLGKTNEPRLASMTPPQTAGATKPFVQFVLDCRFPDKTR
jgi:hypothetical protein